ncbi:MAG: DUF503 domain-containing protein [Clostridiales bacterium]|jgi:uncharacterized protein YlxP (DUF503 family)|nr:DUF503 domain-containing protein [Clostridiales bacterium]
MVIGTIKLKIFAPWVHSLKEKRMVVKSLCARIKNKFNVSIAEVEDQDIHQSIVLGVACVTTDNAHADQILDKVIRFIEANTEGEIIHLERENLY